jgi:hypothetical protein
MSPSTRDMVSSFSNSRSDYTPSYFQPPASHTQTSGSYLGSSGPLYARTSRLDSSNSQFQLSTCSPGTDSSNYSHTATSSSFSQGTWPSMSRYYSTSLEEIDPQVPPERDSWTDHKTMSPSSGSEFSDSIVSPYGLEHRLDLGDRNRPSERPSSCSSTARTKTTSARSNNEDFISDIASDVWGGLRNSPANDTNYKRISRPSVGKPVTMEDGSNDGIA